MLGSIPLGSKVLSHDKHPEHGSCRYFLYKYAKLPQSIPELQISNDENGER